MKAVKPLAAFALALNLISTVGPAIQPRPAQALARSALPRAGASAAAPAAIDDSTLDAPLPSADRGTQGEPVPEAIASVPGATQDWWAAVQEQIERGRHVLSREGGQDGDVSYRGHNAATGFGLAFSSGGVRLSPAQPVPEDRDGSSARLEAAGAQPAEAEAGKEWEWGLRLIGYGYASTSLSTGAGHLQPVSALAEMVADGNRIEYRRGAVTEWYVNGGRGLKQGFTLAAPPSPKRPAEVGERGEGLILEMALETDLVPVLAGDAQTIDFKRGGDNVILLRYTELQVFDATHRMLPARFALTRQGRIIRIIIDDAGASYPLTVDPLATTTPTWTAVGEDTSFGQSVAAAGDVNGDGFADLVIGAWSYSDLSTRGKAFVYHGSATGLSTTPAWSRDGEDDLHNFGWAVGTAGDVNGDGYDDLVVGARRYVDDRGKAYVYHGSATGLSSTAAWTKTGGVGDWLGHSVGTAGDVNGDGFDDLVIGAPEANSAGGRAYVYHGSSTGLSDSPASTISGAVQGLKVDYLGWDVGTAGDVNGDGYDDVIIGGRGHEYYLGKAWVFLGTAIGLDTSAPWTAIGENQGDHYGRSVGTAGDVNGDGYDDVIVGAPYYYNYMGKVYVYLGAEGGLSNDPSWAVTGETTNAYFGIAIGTAGDAYGGDGYDDIIIGSSTYNESRGKAYVYAGSEDGLSETPVWTASPQFIVERFGRAVGTAGDVNGDGYADLAIGAPSRARVYVYHGLGIGPSGAPAWTDAGESTGDEFGYAVTTAGDVNGDGYADVAVGIPGYDDDTGQTQVYRGSAAGLGTTPSWIATGESRGDLYGFAVGPAGDVNADGFDDLVVGAAGYERWTGKVYVFLGSALGLADTVAWTATGENAGDRLGAAVGTAGDVNNDRFADLAIGAYGFPRGNDYGKAYVYHGSETGLESTPAWGGSGESGGDRFGRSMGTAGDVNGDGFDDLVVGAYGYDGYGGKAYAYHGSETGLSITPEWTVRRWGDERFGLAVGTAGDVNGDGFADVIVGGRGYDEGGSPNGCRVRVYHGSVAGLSGTHDWSMAPYTADTYFGSAVGTAGDVNGDGYADIIIGASRHYAYTGQVYVFLGSATGVDASYLSDAWFANGETIGDRFGAALGTAGDVNGDGLSDLIVGAYRSDLGQGEAYVFYGAGEGLSSDPASTNMGEYGGNTYGTAVAAAGDVNGDGYADVAVGAPWYDAGVDWGHGRVYVYLGSASGLSASAAFTATGENARDFLGSAVGTAGDVNGDGYADLIVGAGGYPSSSYTGKAYVYHGSSSGLESAPAWTATGESLGDGFSYAVGTAGDVNGDGYADVIVGAYMRDGDTGKAYVYHGAADGLHATPDWTAQGESAGGRFGQSLGTAGDVNGDGYADVIVGADGNQYGTGKVYVYHGAASGLGEIPAWTDVGEDHPNLGAAVGTAGDVNGDGYADVIVGATGYDSYAGRAYVYHGSATGLDSPFTSFTPEDADERFGHAVSTAGDVNGDGYADVVVGAFGYPPAVFTGTVHLCHGSSTGVIPTFDWSAIGEKAGDRFGWAVGTAGDVNGDGFADVVIGAEGHDGNRGKMYVYQGGDGGGRAALARAARGDDSDAPVQPWGVSRNPESFQVSLRAVHPLGRSRAGLEIEACPPGVPFGHTSCRHHLSSTWREAVGDTGRPLIETITGLEKGTLYRWRARVLYDSPLYVHGPWRRFLGQAIEADVRSMDLPTDLVITKAVTPTLPAIGQPITYTLTFYAATGPATGVVVTDIVPSEITDVAAVSSGVTITDTGASPGYVWQVQDLLPGQVGVITVTGVASATRFINTAAITTTSIELVPEDNVSVVQTHIPGIIFVDQDAAGPIQDGLSWVTAYTDLQDGLDAASSGDEIWVAQGAYRPTNVAGRAATFQLVEGVRLYGGFEGSESWRHERDWMVHPTVLSGDLGVIGQQSDNAYHVISATNVTSSTVVDGFSVSGGNADGGGMDDLGGGMLCDGASPVLLNVTFSGNVAIRGGGMFNANGGKPTLIDVAFSGNSASSDGGGMTNVGGSDPTLMNVTLTGNSAGGRGGGLFTETGAGATVHNSIIWGNSPDQISQDWVGQTTVSYCDVEGGWFGPGAIDVDPAFYDADGADDVPGTLDDDLRLRYTSGVIDAGDNSLVPADDFDLDGDGVFTESLPLDLSGRSRLIGFTVVTPTVDMGAYEATILDVIAEADGLRELGTRFRLEQVQLLPADTMVQALQNYQNFNDGELFYDFCADHNEIDENGYCPQDSGRQNVRNTLLDSIALYEVAMGWPTADWTTQDGVEIPVRDIGGSGVVSSVHEIANVHLIFGNEFLVDAIDYRFSTAGIPYADEIINDELEELGQARQQFELTMDLLFRAFGRDEWGVGDYFSSHDFETFGVASSRMMTTLDEMAARYRMLGDDQAALDVYDRAYEEQYMQLTALAQMAHEVGVEYLQNGSWEMFNNLSRMRDRAQAIRDGLDFFGFAPDYVPLQSYNQLLELTEGPTGDTGLLGTAHDLEDQAREAQRTFDRNASDMSTELDNLTVALGDQLFELCGETEDEDEDGFGDYATCEGGLMEQNLQTMYAASLRVGLAWKRAQDIASQIRIEQERAGKVIEVDLGLAQTVSAIDLAIGKLSAYQETYASAIVAEHKIHSGVQATAGWYQEVMWTNKGPEAKSGLKTAVELSVGYQNSVSWIASSNTTWAPNVELIGQWNSIKTLREAEARAQITGANSAATIKNLLLQQSQALIEAEVAQAEFDKLVAEHNHLAQRRSRLLNKRAQAINRVVNHNSHLLSPAYRVLRDTLTVQSAEAHGLSAQFAYLAARAAEYELLTPYPALNDVYKARTANDIRLLLNDLKVWYQALNRPGQLNRYPYAISVAKDILGLTDQNLDPDGVMSEEELDELRYSRFQDYLQENLDGDGLEFWFITSLNQLRAENQYLFSPNIWNNRIAGIGAPLAENGGVSVNIVTHQTGEVGHPEVVLVHDGQASYRNAAGEIVHYDPGTAVPVGYVLPDELDPESTTVVVRPGINGTGAIANSGLVNLSVAASHWTLRIPAESKGNLDLGQIEDIEITLDTTGRALPGRASQAEQDALRLHAGLSLAPPAREAVGRWDGTRVCDRAGGEISAIPQADGQGISGSYHGGIVVTSPLTVAVQTLDFDLANLGGVLSGTVNITETPLYHGSIGLHGIVKGKAFTITSDVITNVVMGRSVQRCFTLVGRAGEGGDILRATYTGVITNLLPSPIVEEGRFFASRPVVPASERLVLQAEHPSVPLFGSTTITVVHLSELAQPVTATTRVTFTSDMGTVIPDATDTVEGTAVATFNAGGVTGEATIFATTGEITGTTSVQVLRSHNVYLPLVMRAGLALRRSGGAGYVRHPR